jgi:RNA polymerase sigma factor (sigma-70 family)
VFHEESDHRTEPDAGDAAALFLRELGTIEQAIRFASRRPAFSREDAEDFASYVKLKLIENNYAIVRKYRAQASFAAFISVVVQRMLLDYRITQWGKWHASAKAQRMGEPAITIEAMLVRDGRSLGEIMSALSRRWPDMTRQQVEAIAAQLPHRAIRPRAVELDLEKTQFASSSEDFEEPLLAVHRRILGHKIQSVVNTTLNDLEELDRVVFKLRFEGGMSVADIARTLCVDQKPLYRRLKRALLRLREQLEAAGITAAEAAEVLASRHNHLDFGFLLSSHDGESVRTEDM